MHVCQWKSMKDATPSPISAIISLCNMGYLWKNVQSPMNPTCTAPFKHSIVMAKPTWRRARWSLHAWLRLLRAVSQTCLFSRKHCIVPDQPVLAQPINTRISPKQRKVLLHMRLNDSCHPTKTSFWSDQNRQINRHPRCHGMLFKDTHAETVLNFYIKINGYLSIRRLRHEWKTDR